MKYVWTQQAINELKARLPRSRINPTGGPDIKKPLPTGGKVKRGTPQAIHAGDGVATQTYNLDNGSTQDGVLNKTGVSALTTASYWLFNVDGTWQSFPAELDTCNPSNPQVVT